MVYLKEILDYAFNITPKQVNELGLSIHENVNSKLDNIIPHSFLDGDYIYSILEDYENFTNESWEAIIRNLFTGVTYSCVDSHGGNEGEGEYCHRVFKFSLDSTDQVEYVKFYGSYYSYDGIYYSGYNFVKPVDRMVTFYE